MKGGPLETLKKLRKKVSQSRKKSAQKIFGQGWTRTHVFLIGRPQKSRNLYAKCQ